MEINTRTTTVCFLKDFHTVETITDLHTVEITKGFEISAACQLSWTKGHSARKF